MYAVWLLTEQRRQKEHEVHKLGVFATVAILGHKLWRNRALTGQARLWRQKLDALSEEHFPNAWQNPSARPHPSPRQFRISEYPRFMGGSLQRESKSVKKYRDANVQRIKHFTARCPHNKGKAPPPKGIMQITYCYATACKLDVGICKLRRFIEHK